MGLIILGQNNIIRRLFIYFFVTIITLSSFLTILLLTNNIAVAKNPTSSLAGDRLVAHAMGEINGVSYTNSLEAFIENYKAGYRVFEVDLIFTSDNKLVAKHDWSSNDNVKLSYDEYMGSKIDGKYTPLDFQDIVQLMQNYKDIHIITDTKETDQENVVKAFELIYSISAKINYSTLNRIIPQIYNQDMYNWVTKIFKFKDTIYTLYQSNDSDDQVIDFVSNKDIGIVTLSTSRFSEGFVSKLNSINVNTYIHTINSADETQLYLNKGVYGFYTDSLKTLGSVSDTTKPFNPTNVSLSNTLVRSL